MLMVWKNAVRNTTYLMNKNRININERKTQ